MASFDIGLYPSSDLDSAHGNTPVDRAETHLNDALNNASQHSVTIHTNTGTVDAPIETVGPSFSTADKPCTVPTPDDVQWSDLGEWWYQYTSRCGAPDHDAVVLITSGNYSGTVGKCYNNYACVCEGGQHLPDLPPNYTGQGSGIEYRAINTVLHEIGHAIISANVNEHKVYDTYQSSSGNWGKTAMETGALGPISQNECGDSVHSATSGQEATGYSECAESKM